MNFFKLKKKNYDQHRYVRTSFCLKNFKYTKTHNISFSCVLYDPLIYVQ